jgi:hypothetical protein
MMCKHFKDEKERQRAVLPVLNDIFASYRPYTLPPIVPSKVVGERTSGGHANGPVQAMEVVLEIKNEFGSGSTDPEIQYTSYYVQMYESQIRSGPYKDCFEKYICPVLGISIIGIRRDFHAACLFSYLFFRFKHRIWCSHPPRQGKMCATHTTTLSPFSLR